PVKVALTLLMSASLVASPSIARSESPPRIPSFGPTGGRLDSTFGVDGKVITDFGSGGDDFARAIAIQSDGRIVAAGQSSNGTDDDVALARYNVDGTLDTSFGIDGLVTYPAAFDQTAYSVDVTSDGRIVVGAGWTLGGAYLLRYQPDGTLDPTFGQGGVVT